MESIFDYAIVELTWYMPEYIFDGRMFGASRTRQGVALLWDSCGASTHVFSALAAIREGNGSADCRPLYGLCESEGIITAYTDLSTVLDRSRPDVEVVDEENCSWYRPRWQAALDLAAPDLCLNIEVIPTRKLPIRHGETRAVPLYRIDSELLPEGHPLRMIPEQDRLGYGS